MAKHFLKLIVLLIPSLATVTLLFYCLFSDTWIQINQGRLHNMTVLYENEYHEITGRGDQALIAKNMHIINARREQLQRSRSSSVDIVNYRQHSTSVIPASTTTTTVVESTTTTSTLSSVVSTTTEVIGENVYETETEQSGEEETGGEEYVDTDSTVQEENLKRNRRGLSRPNNFVYVTKLWPFVKLKSLYSECVEYHRLRLKMSTAYLTLERKEPIVGVIDYIDGSLREGEHDSACDEKSGKIQCLFSKKCVTGKSCDGVVHCDDQSDEQLCDSDRVCNFQTGITGFKCDNRCWQYWSKCDHTPHCLDLSDEISPDCAQPLHLSLATFSTLQRLNNFTAHIVKHDHASFAFGSSHYEARARCFKSFFNFKSAKLIHKDNLKYLSQPLADNIQEMNNLNYQLQLIYTLSFVFALFFALMALASLLFLSCFKKLCFQCPFWFYGFFQILCWLSSLVGLMTFFYAYYNNKQRMLDPSVHLPIDTELVRLNQELVSVEQLGVSFWLAVAATCTAFVASLFSCLVCCRLPSARHEDKEYKIMQLPAYN